MTRITGAGWIDKKAFGTVRSNRTALRPAGATLPELCKNHDIFAYPVKNFGRFDATSKHACIAAALAMRDAAVPYAAGRHLPIGIVMAAPDCSQAANERYYRDYIDGGRALARGNLFIYTLPTSAIAEAAIHFGLAGPTLCLGSVTPGPAAGLRAADHIVSRNEAEGVLLVGASETEALAFLVKPDSTRPEICATDTLLHSLHPHAELSSWVAAMLEFVARGTDA